jgi:hypothetical protein
MKSGKLNFLQTSGPFQDCNGTALPINEIYVANGDILHAKLGGIYNYTGLNFEDLMTVNKSARILSKHVRPSQFFPF